MNVLLLKLKLLIKDIIGIKKYLANLNRKTLPLFIKEPFSMRRIILWLGGRFYIKDKSLILELPNNNTLFKKDVSFYIETEEIIGLIAGMAKDDAYTFDDKKNEYIVIDIGMNIGDTALFFASYDNVKRVYAFEPFEPTYKKACANFKLNGNLSSKITSYNFGISDKDETLDIYYSPNIAGSMTTDNSEYNKSKSTSKNIIKETIILKSINYIFEKILTPPPPPHKIILKLDCEGAEYNILDEMDKKGLFKYVDIIMLEWHRKGKESLLETLSKNNFFSFSLLNCAEFGMLYSVKTKQE
jgi:FkbM family methyltransferase